jgi:parallel beta-helix repeat protein
MVRRLGAVAVAVAIGIIGIALASPAGAAGIVVVRPGESIQAAVDAAGPNSTIVVQRGTYAENVEITNDNVKVIGTGATLVPPAESAPNGCSFGEPAQDGFCIVGVVDDQGNVLDPVTNVSINGFTVQNFGGSGVIYFGAENPSVTNVHAIDNGEYGIARFASSGGKLVANTASGSEEAGIYVGDSPNADVLIVGNDVSDNLFGFFLRDSANGRVLGNTAHDNCVGLIVLNTGSNTAGDYTIAGNRIVDNTKFCPGDDEEEIPPFSGDGVAIVGGSGNRVTGNIIVGNVPSGAVPFSGGVAVLDFGIPGANPPSDNTVVGNMILNNQPDVFYDGSGSGNTFRANLCHTSVPAGLC